MSNMPATHKKKVSLQLKIETIAKIDHAAKAANVSRNEMTQMYLDRATSRVSLTAEEIQAVADEQKRNEENRKHGK